jgi:hypothetical protein
MQSNVLLSPSSEPHKYETFLYVDQRLSLYLNVAAQADDMSPPAYAEARAFLLHSVVELYGSPHFDRA